MCRENTQKPQIPHCWCRWKGPTKPNHFISANSLSYCGMPLRCWVLRCHTTNWESQQGPLFGPLHRLCTATVITTIIWLPENIKCARGSCRNLHFPLWSARFKMKRVLTLSRAWRLQCPALLHAPAAASPRVFCRSYFGNRQTQITY